jgi:transcription antitermination factor NusG
MQKKWFIIYTRPHKENKIVAMLSKKKITSYCPLNHKKSGFARTKKIILEPLFTSYVFVNTTEKVLEELKYADNIISLVYWKGHPAIVSENEINSIKEFSDTYPFIKLIPSKVCENPNAIVDNSSYSLEGNLLLVNKIKRLSLPSLGFIMAPETGNEPGKDSSFAKKEIEKVFIAETAGVSI